MRTKMAQITFALGLLSPAFLPAQDTLRVFNYPNYIASSTIKNYEAKNKTKVVYEEYDSVDEAQAKLLAGNSGYDVVIIAAVPNSAELIKAGRLLPLESRKLRNFGNLDSSLLLSLENVDVGNRYLIPYLWGTTGLGVNDIKVRAVLGLPEGDKLLQSWRLLFDPVNAKKLASCGISVLDDGAEAVAAGLVYLGFKPNSMQPAQLAAVESLYKKIRPYVRTFTSSEYLEPMAEGKTCLVMGYSSDLLQARAQALAANKGVTVRYLIPAEGSVRWLDVVAITADTKNVAGAHAFIDYLMDPEVIAQVSNEVGAANANEQSARFLKKEVRRDPAIYPDYKLASKLSENSAMSAADQQVRDKLWERIKLPVR